MFFGMNQLNRVLVCAFLLVCGSASAQVQTVFHYSFQQGTNLSNVIDQSTMGHHAVGGPLAGLSADIPFDGLGNRSLDPSQSGASQANPSGLVTSETQLLDNALVNSHGGFTMETWFRWDGGGGALMVLLDYAGTEKIMVRDSGELVFLASDSSWYSLNVSATPGQWHYVAVVFDTEGQAVGLSGQPGMLTMYFDSTTPLAAPAAMIKSNYGDLLNRSIGIGQHPNGGFHEFLDGRIFEPRVSLGALEPSELLLAGTPGHFDTLFQVNEDASLSNGYLRLTPEAHYQRGSAFTHVPQLIDGQSFQAFFSFRMTVSGTTGADGMAFVMQNDPSGAAAIGVHGSGIGFSGLTTYAAVVLDSYEGASGGDHEVRLVVDNLTAKEVSAPFALNGGDLCYCWIAYSDLGKSIEVYLSTTPQRPASPVLSESNFDLSQIIGSEAYFGVTAATGGLREAHDVESFWLSTTAFLTTQFLRGDCQGDGGVAIPDAIASLGHLFLGSSVPCLDACDVNADGVINLLDPILLLEHLFFSAAPPPAPYPACESGAAGSVLGCELGSCP